jgi:hypothetical protein
MATGVNPQQVLQQLQQLIQQGGPGGLKVPTVPGAGQPGPQITPSAAGTPMPAPTGHPSGFVPFQPGTQGGQTEYRTKGGARSAGLQSLGANVTSLINTVQQRHHDRQAAMAEGYMDQIQALLRSGDPKDVEKAKLLLDDKKILQTLDKGLNYKPLEEEVPPEAVGVTTSIQKAKKQPQGPTGGPGPGRQPIIPQGNPQDILRSMVTNAMIQRGKQDPQSLLGMTGNVGMGQAPSMLSGPQQKQAEEFAAGFGISPKEYAQMDLSSQMASQKILQQVMRDQLQFQMYEDRIKGMKDLKASDYDIKKYMTDQNNAAKKWIANEISGTKEKGTFASIISTRGTQLRSMAEKFRTATKDPTSLQALIAQGLVTSKDELASKADSYEQQADKMDKLLPQLMGMSELDPQTKMGIIGAFTSDTPGSNPDEQSFDLPPDLGASEPK